MKRISVLISLVLIATCLAGCRVGVKKRIDVESAKLFAAPFEHLGICASQKEEIVPVVDFGAQMVSFDDNLPGRTLRASYLNGPQKVTYVESGKLWGGQILDTYEAKNGAVFHVDRNTNQILFWNNHNARAGLSMERDEAGALPDAVLQQKALAHAKEMIPGLVPDAVQMNHGTYSCTVTFVENYSGASSISRVSVRLDYDGALRSVSAFNYGCMDGLADAEFDKAALDRRLDAHMQERFSDCGMLYEIEDAYFMPDLDNERLLYHYYLTVETFSGEKRGEGVNGTVPYELYFDVGPIKYFQMT